MDRVRRGRCPLPPVGAEVSGGQVVRWQRTVMRSVGGGTRNGSQTLAGRSGVWAGQRGASQAASAGDAPSPWLNLLTGAACVSGQIKSLVQHPRPAASAAV